MTDQIKIPNVGADAKTPVFLVKSMPGKTKRYNAWCLNKTHMPKVPNKDLSFAFLGNFVQLKGFMDIMEDHIKEKVAAEENASSETSEPSTTPASQEATQQPPEHQETTTPEQSQPAPENAQETQPSVPEHYVPIKKEGSA